MSTRTKESRKIARYSLIIMVIGFIATIPFQGSFWVNLIRGGFEAGLIGGLADWFAVTALFRHPLGLKIPHTALLPNNRKRITNGLVKTIKNDWLSKESIQGKIKQISFTDKLVAILESALQKEAFRKGLVKQLQRIIGYIDVEKLTPIVKKQVIASISNLDTSRMLQLASSQLIHAQFDQKALDYLLKKAEGWLNQEKTTYQLGAVSMNVLNKIEFDGILQFAVKSMQNLLNEEKLGSIIKNLLLSVINSLKHEGEPNRKELISYIQKELQGLNENQELVMAIEKWKSQLLDKWEPEHTINNSLLQIKQNIFVFLEDEKFMDNYLIPLLNRVQEKALENRMQIDLWIQKQIAILIEKNHAQIGDLVQENLDKLDNEKLVDMIENNVGKDLQWIRVNGAVCGFIIGLILTGIQDLITFLS